VFVEKKVEVEYNEFYNFRDDLAEDLYKHKASTELFAMDVGDQIIAAAIVKFVATLSQEDSMVYLSVWCVL
jgi:uncharacterized protein YejL (UPF0352 family)